MPRIILCLCAILALSLAFASNAIAETEVQKCEREYNRHIKDAQKDKANAERLKKEKEVAKDLVAVERANILINDCERDIQRFEKEKQKCNKTS